ncbi:Putative tRNA (cytidine(32)/guanosine(34)-2'-O)-methyltransferase [Plasmodium coatneyi]|uniref:Putative tRNA (cytidine(32)/guanosine(34)-2'-O)-methyltransferase n=1 Tax=Plasmodium coatneyi TaxID=208452 RepID=A0A1B1DXR7_9APIC|nr:Putative tRNA (cytidine(32)/guanosine(34)-2'-O)-methyltransferase [Plasmodium coatneyi]ANQ07395.1 Putative tRNA (cytidine(32)/guanosine(34)-2'-O)-methyltransferase [Plasmodium coatneyi]
MGKLSKDRRDIYYRKAKENGYRARSSFKLIQINEKFGIFKLFDPKNYWEKDMDKIRNIYNEHFCYNIVDLCAAPGSWSQVLKNICLYNYYQMLHWVNTNEGNPPNCDEHEKFLNNFSLYVNFNDELEKRIENLPKKEFVKKPKIIAVDLQEIGNMKYVQIIQGDITKASTVHEILRCMKEGEVGNGMGDGTVQGIDQLNGQNAERKNFPTYAHAVVNDGAPDITGMNDIDEFIQSQLILSSLKVCCSVLKIGGNFISKIFRGEHTGLLILHLNKFFERVYVCKPQSSRNKSLESFLVCLNFSLPLCKITALSHHTGGKKFNLQNMPEEELRKMHAKLITEKDNEGEIRKRGKSFSREEKRDDTTSGEELSADTSGEDSQVESEGNKEDDGKDENEFAHISECTSDDAEGGNILKGDGRKDYNLERGDTLMGEKSRSKNFAHKNVDIFNFYCSDSDEEIKYFNSDDEEIVNEYIASEVFMNDKLFSFVATQNYYDSDKSYLLPQNYVRHEPQLMPLQPPYLLSLQKKRQEGKKPQ